MKIVGLMLTVVVLGLILYFAFGRKDPAVSQTATVGTALGAAAPVDVAANPKAARLHAERQGCLANCAAEFSTCKNTAIESPQSEACVTAKTACDGRCP